MNPSPRAKHAKLPQSGVLSDRSHDREQRDEQGVQCKWSSHTQREQWWCLSQTEKIGQRNQSGSIQKERKLNNKALTSDAPEDEEPEEGVEITTDMTNARVDGGKETEIADEAIAESDLEEDPISARKRRRSRSLSLSPLTEDPCPGTTLTFTTSLAKAAHASSRQWQYNPTRSVTLDTADSTKFNESEEEEVGNGPSEGRRESGAGGGSDRVA